MLFEEPQALSLEEITKKLSEICQKLLEAPVYAFDLETTGLDTQTDRITTFSFATREESWALETAVYSIQLIRKYLKPVFDDGAKTVVFHNANFDQKFLQRAGIWLKNKLADTMVLAWLFREDKFMTAVRNAEGKIEGDSGHGLKHLVNRYLNHKMTSFKEANSLFGDLSGYAADDAKYTLRLYFWLQSQLAPKILKWFDEVECQITKILIEMEVRGVQLDPDELKILKKEAYTKIEEISNKIYSLVGYEFEISSAEQCAKALFDDLGVGKISQDYNKFSARGESGVWSTSDDILKAVARAKELTDKEREIAKLLLEFRELNTRLNNFIKPLLERCLESTVIHPSFLQIGTKTGRFSSKNPNYQNLPRKGGIRKCFIARKGYKICRIDYQQAELRLMAHFSQDPVMLQIYKNAGDIHTTTAQACGISRQAAKAVNFGAIYRMSAKRLQDQLAFEGILFTIEQCQDFLNKYFKNYAGIRSFHKRVEREVLNRISNGEEFGYVTTLGGRLRRLDRKYLTDEETSYTAITQAINAIIQGGVADLIKFAMIRVQNIFKERGWLNPEMNIWDATISGQVHDELFVEAKEEIAEEVLSILKQELEYAGIYFGITVPMTADGKIVNNLGEK